MTTGGTYTVTNTVNGCTSSAGSGVAAPVAIPSAPSVSVQNNCGNSVLSANAAGSLLWSNSANTSSITVFTEGTYTVTTTVNGCTSNPGSEVAAPIAIPSTPLVNVQNNCGNSVLSTNAIGTLLWSNSASTASITVNTGGTYTVTNTINGCTSIAGSGVAAPVAIPSTPSVSVQNNCGNSVLSTNAPGTLLWSNSASTSSITVTTGGTYTVTSSVNGCLSAVGSGIAAPYNNVNVSLTSKTDIYCLPSTGAIDITATGGTGTLSYSWTGTGVSTISEDQTGLASGSYSVIVSDANSCSSSLNVTLYDYPVHNTNTGLYYSTIQDAINASATVNGNLIQVCAGTFTENVTVNKSVTINGAGYTTKLHSVTANGNIFTISANYVTLSNMHLEGSPDISGSSATRGIYFNSTLSNVDITNVKASLHQFAILADNSSDVSNLNITNCELLASGNGLQVNHQAKVAYLTITGGSISGNLYGFSSNAYLGPTNNNLGLTNISVIGTTFSNNTIKGLYFEKLNNANFDNITVTNNGTDATAALQAAGMDINLKAGTYVNINILNSTFTGNGKNNNNGGAILAKARISGGGGLYATYPAYLANLTIDFNIFTDNGGGTWGAAVRIGESNNSFTGTDNGPNNVEIYNNSFIGNSVHAIRNASTAQIANATCNWYGVSNNTIATMISGDVVFTPWLSTGTVGVGNGFQPTGNCDGGMLYKISGTLKYNSDPNPQIPLVGFTVNLKDGINTVATTTTDVNGYYEFNVPNGTYTIESSASNSAQYYSDWDDVMAIYNWSYSVPFANQNSLRELACDVNQDNSVDFTDVMAVYYKSFGVSTPDFTLQDFIFENPSIIVNSSAVSQNILGICSGNVLGTNASPNQ